MMRVVSGALIRDGKVLMGLRKERGYRPNLWELPGGKIDGGETPGEALRREWQEELDVNIMPGQFISVAMLHLDITFAIELYEVHLVSDRIRDTYGVPKALDHQKLRWVDPGVAVRWMPCSPAFYLHYPQLRSRVHSGCVDPTCEYCHPRPPWEQ